MESSSASNGKPVSSTESSVQQLKQQIAAQKALYKSLETDRENPRLLDSQIENLAEVLQHLPKRLDDEIEKRYAELQALIDSRDAKIADKQTKLQTLLHRKENIQDLYIQAWDQLQEMNQRLKRLEHGDTLERLRAMRAEYAKLMAELPEKLKGIESVDEFKALEDMIDDDELED